MDRELLLEVGTEELPASWLPGLTHQIGEVVVAQLKAHRLGVDAPVETFSTPRRLTVRVARVAERQSDLEELVTGPPVSAGVKPDGTFTPAVTGFAAKQGVEVAALERVVTPKGEYFAFRKRQRARAAVDVLGEVLGDALRALAFPKAMRWDAALDDGRGELLFGRPIRWILYLYGGRVVPFTIARTPAAETAQVQEVRAGAVTYGHRFLTTSGRAGRAIKVRSFDEYRARLLENFVVLERSERHDKIARALDAKAQRLQGRVSRLVKAESSLLREVPDLIEYPSVIAGTFAPEFLELPAEVLTTTLIHHQHYFPVEGDDGALKNAFLAVINTEPDNERTIARNAERVVTARLRDARFFFEADRLVPLDARAERLATLTFHKKLGSYQQKAERVGRLAGWIAEHALGVPAAVAAQAARAGWLSKADLTTDMVREFTELQGTIGGVYARQAGEPEAVWKAIYFHYLPLGVEADAPPTRAQLGEGAATWAAVALADKLDTLVGLFAAGEKPTGSRDPFGLRRAAQGVVKVLVDLPAATGLDLSVDLEALITQAFAGYGSTIPAPVEGWMSSLGEFFAEREAHVLDRRGFRGDEARAVLGHWARPTSLLKRASALALARRSSEFEALAVLFKRVKNITKQFDGGDMLPHKRSALVEPSELALLREVDVRLPVIERASAEERYGDAMREIGALGGPVNQFFADVLVMAEDPALRDARLTLLGILRRTILSIADIAEVAPDDMKSG
ncbi:MAG: glycine--tRNA ligase subunit beta [Acidobacteriota bacterium]